MEKEREIEGGRDRREREKEAECQTETEMKKIPKKVVIGRCINFIYKITNSKREKVKILCKCLKK